MGRSGFVFKSLQTSFEVTLAKSSRLYSGALKNASISPVDGSIATTAPRLSLNASSATRWASLSIVKIKSSPLIVPDPLHRLHIFQLFSASSQQACI